MSISESTMKVTHVEPCGDGKVCLTMQLVVDAHYLVEVSGQLLSVAAKGASASKKKQSNPG